MCGWRANLIVLVVNWTKEGRSKEDGSKDDCPEGQMEGECCRDHEWS